MLPTSALGILRDTYHVQREKKGGKSFPFAFRLERIVREREAAGAESHL